MRLTNTSTDTDTSFLASVDVHVPDLCRGILLRKNIWIIFYYGVWFFFSHSFSKTITSLGIKLEDYWKEIYHMRKQEDPNSIPVEDAVLVHYRASLNVLHTLFCTCGPFILQVLCFTNFISHLSDSLYRSLCVFRKRPDQNWVQCDECLKWRKLPDGIDCDKLPDKWFCLMNPDPQFR